MSYSKPNRTAYLIYARLTGAISHSEQHELSQWLMKAENRALFDHIQKRWQASESETPVDFGIESNLKILKAKIHQYERSRRRSKLPKAAEAVLKIAAITLIFIGAYWSFHQRWERDAVLRSGEHITRIELPDSSVVWLNRNSTLTYRKSFDSNVREVELVGEGFFEVRRNSDRPFLVKTDRSSIRVLGTSFNVHAYGDRPYQVVSVVTGLVSFSERQGGKEVLLEPGHSGVFDKLNLSLRTQRTTDENFLAWKTKTLSFRDTPLAQVVQTLNSSFASRIAVETSAIDSCRFTGTFKDSSLTYVLETISMSLNLQVVDHGDSFGLIGEGCGQYK